VIVVSFFFFLFFFSFLHVISLRRERPLRLVQYITAHFVAHLLLVHMLMENVIWQCYGWGG
jgi:hypothetical protein